MELKEIASFRSSTSKSKTLDSINNNEEETILIKLQNKQANSSTFNDLSNQYRNKYALIIQESSCEAKTTIYWKSAEIDEFLTLKPNEKLKTEAGRKLNEFIVDFLFNSIKNNHLGKFQCDCESKTQN